MFLYEAFLSGAFRRLVVAEVLPSLVENIRRNQGEYWVNIATRTGIQKQKITGIEIFNPNIKEDRNQLVQAIAGASEISTALPDVKFYRSDSGTDVVSLLSEGLKQKAERNDFSRAIIYTAENHNHAAEILEEHLARRLPARNTASCFHVLNTVIGKMSGVITEKNSIEKHGLEPMTTEGDRALLVEEFNRILITRIRWNDFERNIRVFEEKENLLPFEEAKLYGHNATHALIGYLLRRQGKTWIADARTCPDLLQMARAAFLEESGQSLCRKWKGTDPLFTADGYRRYAEDLLERMVNPFLLDTVERITRDSRRKLGWNDRLTGTMRMVLSQHLSPDRYAAGAAAALEIASAETAKEPAVLLDEIWKEDGVGKEQQEPVKQLILKAMNLQ